MTEAAEFLDAAYYFDFGIGHLAVATGMAAVFSKASEDKIRELATKIKNNEPTATIGELLD